MIPEQRGITNARAVLVERFISACCRLALKWLASHLRPSRGAPPSMLRFRVTLCVRYMNDWSATIPISAQRLSTVHYRAVMSRL